MSLIKKFWDWWSPKPVAASPKPAQKPVSVPSIAGTNAYSISLKEVLKWEGTYDDDKYDPGGRTAFGIIQREYNAWLKKHGKPSPKDVWTITPQEVSAIYRENYWQPLRCDELPHAVANVLWDYAINSGLRQATKDAQRALGITADGVYGMQTFNALRSPNLDQALFIERLSERRMILLQGLSTWWRFGRGWTNRVVGVKAFSLKLVK